MDTDDTQLTSGDDADPAEEEFYGPDGPFVNGEAVDPDAPGYLRGTAMWRD